MKKFKFLISAILLGLVVFSAFSLKALNTVKIYLFHDPLCSHCQAEEAFLHELESEYENIEIIIIDVTANDENFDNFEAVKSVFEEDEALTPYTVIGGVSLRGFSEQTKLDIVSLVERYSEESHSDIVAKVLAGEEVLLSDFDKLERDVVWIPLIGEIQIKDVSLLLGAIIIGFVDGFNPCAMWVLILLITLLINSQDKKRMWWLGVIFLTTSALVYFLIMMSWLRIAIALSVINWFRYLIGAFAISFGCYNLYKFFKKLNEEDGCEVVQEKRKIKIIERVKKVIHQDKLVLAIIGIIALAVTVNLIELACSAGLPLLYTNILAFNNLSGFAYTGYVLIYVFFFLLDDLIIFTIAMVSMRVTGISNRYTKYSSLIGGLIMALIGFLLIFFPDIIMF
jgi:thiol-disulfide isomerase/thioredoxin